MPPAALGCPDNSNKRTGGLWQEKKQKKKKKTHMKKKPEKGGVHSLMIMFLMSIASLEEAEQLVVCVSQTSPPCPLPADH